MNLKEFIEEKNKNINEGIIFFKESDKLRKLASKMEHSVLINISDPKQREEVKDYILKVKEATSEFDNVEEEYKTGDKKKAKDIYKQLKIKYSSELAKVDKPLLGIFKQYGSSMLYFATIQIFSMLLLPKIASFGKPSKH
jgi:hypothetical protein